MNVVYRAFTFLQVSDVHLDSKLTSHRLNLSPVKRRERNKEILDSLLSVLDLARERKVDAVLIPGDLWDSESISTQTVNRLIEAFCELSPIPVVIAPGNHDYYSKDSLYSSATLSFRGMRTWPENTHIFSSGNFETFRHPLRNDVSFTGRAFTANVPSSERLLTGVVPRDQDTAINILLFHGSLDGYVGGDSGWPGKLTAPFSAAELLRLEFNYAALGHYHDCTKIKTDSGNLLGAYSGCLSGRGLDECGPRYAIFGTIGQDGRCQIESFEADKRRVFSIRCSITGLTLQQVTNQVSQLLQNAGARSAVDIVHLTLTGRHLIGAEPSYIYEQFANAYYHFIVDDQSRPDYAIDGSDRRTTEGRFIQAMLKLKQDALDAGGALIDNSYDGELGIDAIEDALYYGLDALKQKKVTVRHVD